MVEAPDLERDEIVGLTPSGQAESVCSPVPGGLDDCLAI